MDREWGGPKIHALAAENGMNVFPEVLRAEVVAIRGPLDRPHPGQEQGLRPPVHREHLRPFTSALGFGGES